MAKVKAKGTAKKGRPGKAPAKSTAVAVVEAAPIRVSDQIPQDQIERVAKREASLPANVGLNMQALLNRAIDKMVPIDYLQKILDLVEKQRAQWAKERFFEDMALFQAECPIIEKTKEARDTRPGKGDLLLYVYAPYEDIAAVVQPVLTRHGFSAAIKTKVESHDSVRIVTSTCVIRHKDGHSEETIFEVPVGEGTQIMSPMQKVAAASSFSRRYAYRDALNLAMKGEDVGLVADEGDAEKSHSTPSPQPRQGVKVQENGKKIDEPKAEKPLDTVPDELTKARKDCQEIFSKMAKKVMTADGEEVMLYTVEELTMMREQAKAATTDIEKLRNYALDWAAGYSERLADKGLKL